MSSSRAPAEGEELYDQGGCDNGNELKEFKRQARQTWYSEHAERREILAFGHQELEYRRLNNRESWFRLNVDPSNGKSEIIELKRTGKILQVRWIPLPEQDDWKNGADGHQAILRRIPALADHEAGRVVQILSETFATRGPRPRFEHKCRDGSVKLMRLDPDPMTDHVPFKRCTVDIYLSSRNSASGDQYDSAETLTGLWTSFLANEHQHPKTAFELLEDLITQSETSTLKSHASGSFEFYEYRKESNRYFRWFEGLSTTEIAEYQPHTGQVTYLSKSLVAQASVGHRRTRIYEPMNQF